LAKKSKNKVLDEIFDLVEQLTSKDKKVLLNKLKQDTVVPISIFKSKLSGLEAIVSYLREVEKKSVKEIASELKRKPTTIYTTCERAKIKKVKLKVKEGFQVPLIIFSNRKFSILESLIFYLKNEEKLTIKKISELIGKKEGTVKAVLWRYRKKC